MTLMRTIKRHYKRFLYKRLNGFYEEDLYNLDKAIADFILPRLTEFKKHSYCYPGCYNSFSDWEIDLDKMIFSFSLISSEFVDYLKDIPHEEMVRLNKKKAEGLHLFAKMVESLWI